MGFLIAAEESGGGSFLVSPSLGLMIWTLLLFGATLLILNKLVFPRISDALDRRSKAIAESIVAHLLRLNSEFANYVPAEYRMPRVTLKPMGDAEYFPVGVKHRYTRKTR